jgi:integrase
MARSIHRLSARQVGAAKRPGRYSDGAGLYLRVTGSGGKRWVFRYTPTKGARPREMGLGSAGKGSVSLADAREAAFAFRKQLQNGSDPIALKRIEDAGEVPQFGAFADAFVDGQAVGFRNAKHIAQWRMTLTKYAAPIRAKRVDEITTEDILAILEPIWQTKNETADRLRGRIERVLNAAKARKLRSGENPAAWRGHLELLLPKRNKLQRGHFAAMDYKQIPAFFQELQTREGMAPLALEFLILAACRSGEVRHLEWADLDLKNRVWVIPATKMKAGRMHRVPVTDRMAEIVNRVSPFSQDSPFVFPTRSGQTTLSDAALGAVLKRMGVSKATVHGFRSSFRDWAGDATDYPREVAEAALAHVVGDATERAYRRRDAFEKRTALMGTWSEYCLSG